MSVVVNTVKVALSGVTVANGAGGGAGSFNGIPVLAVNHLDNFAPFKVNSSGHLVVDLGTTPLAVSDNGGSLTVDGSVTIGSALPAGSNNIGSITNITGSVTPGNAAANLGKAEDTAHNSGDTGVAVWGVRNDFGNSFSGSDGDYTPFNVDAQGRLRTLLYGYDSNAMDHYEIAVTAGAINVAQSGTWTVGVATTSGGLGKAEDAGFTTGDVGVMALAVRNNNAATTLTSADADYSPIAVDAAGVQFVKSPYRPTPYKLNSAATTNATSVSATANTLLLGYYISNTNSSVRYVKFYNKASAPTVGTDTPVLVLAIPGSGAANVSFPEGVNFSTGLAFATTTGAADSDTGAVALNEVIVNLVYATY